MTGIICMWSGAIVDIPDGWLLCDGTNGTPDLHDRFIVCASGGHYNPGDKGGSSSHNHALDFSTELGGGAHKHLCDSDSGGPGAGPSHYTDVGGVKELYATHIHSTVDWSSSPDVEHQHLLDDDTEIGYHVPVYYALALIMKT